MIRINNLVAEMFPYVTKDMISVIESHNRVTGETTGKLLTFLGKVISEPNKPHRLPDNPLGYKAKCYDFKRLKIMCEMLDLKCMEFREADMLVTFKLHSYYDNEYDLLKGREKRNAK